MISKYLKGIIMPMLMFWMTLLSPQIVPYAPLDWMKKNYSLLMEVEQSKQSLSMDEIKELLHQQAPNLRVPVLEKTIAALKCSEERHLERKQIVSVIDYSLASNEKRLWVFDLDTKKLLFNTYVSHGIKSGTLLTDNFSNKYNSKASSLGVYKTNKAYVGREGLSLRLDGLESSFNDNASNRSIVMHGGWYVTEDFIKKYGRPGRSWGCPALPPDLYKPIINTIKDNSLLVVYYPTENWLTKSKFLNCESAGIKPNLAEVREPVAASEFRDEVLFANLKDKKEDAILTMSANNYQRIFKNKPPLERMLRRQIGTEEYIALSSSELHRIVQDKSLVPQGDNKELLSTMYFVLPVLAMKHGYYETHMQIIPTERIKNITWNAEASRHFTVYFETKPALSLRASGVFIRWLGL